MKSYVLLLIVVLGTTSAFAQSKPLPTMTNTDRAHISAVLPMVNPDYVWKEAMVMELKRLPQETYQTSYVDSNNVFQWKQIGPREHDIVIAFKYKGTYVYLKNYVSGEYYRAVVPTGQQSLANQKDKRNSQKGERKPISKQQVMETVAMGAQIYGAISGRNINLNGGGSMVQGVQRVIN